MTLNFDNRTVAVKIIGILSVPLENIGTPDT